MQATLPTTRLLMVPLAKHHCNDIINLNSDPQVMMYVENGSPMDCEAATKDHELRLNTRNQIPGLGHWAGYLNEDFVGWWALSPSYRTTEEKKGLDSEDDKVRGDDTEKELDPTRAELGYRLLPQFWKQCLAKEGARELLRHGFEILGLQEVFGQTMAVNVASRATMASCGLRHVRTFYPVFEDPIPGTEEGEVEYLISREEWKNCCQVERSELRRGFVSS